MRSPGYWIKEGIFSHTECESILVFLSKNNVGRNRAGIRNLMRVDEVSSLARDERLLSTCREISGKPLIPYKATLFEKTGRANWLVAIHQIQLCRSNRILLPKVGGRPVENLVSFFHMLLHQFSEEFLRSEFISIRRDLRTVRFA